MSFKTITEIRVDSPIVAQLLISYSPVMLPDASPSLLLSVGTKCWDGSLLIYWYVMGTKNAGLLQITYQSLDRPDRNKTLTWDHHVVLYLAGKDIAMVFWLHLHFGIYYHQFWHHNSHIPMSLWQALQRILEQKLGRMAVRCWNSNHGFMREWLFSLEACQSVLHNPIFGDRIHENIRSITKLCCRAVFLDL